MIEEIYIRDLGVISESRLELGSGLNVLTGETGAGKTMILTALGLLLGNRSDSTSVRQGQAQAVVDGRWKLEEESPLLSDLKTRLTDAGIDLESSEFVVNRSVISDGRSRASLEGRAVPVSLLDELGEDLVVIHGQSDQIRLKSAVAQRVALDNFCGSELRSVLARYQTAFELFKSAAASLSQLRADSSVREQEAAALRQAMVEIEQVDPKPGEDVQLQELADRLTNTEELRLAIAAAHEALSSESMGDANDVLALLANARRSLEQVASYDSRIQEMANTVREISAQVRDLATDVASQLASLESESELSLDQIQERRAQISSLMRRFGPSLDELLEYRANSAQKLLDLESSDYQIEQLTSEVEKLDAEVTALANQLTELRTRNGELLAREVTQELHALAMPGASLVVQVEPAERTNFGADNVSIQLSSYPGAEPRPLGKGASGGELSRIMLAIEVVLAKNKTNPTFIFDEVDAGVGGAAATEIGKRLAKLAKQAQVIVVTHLAQVAAFADTHLRVSKSANEEFTNSSVQRLSDVDRVEELARMLSGLVESELGRAHAAELWQFAKAN